LRRDQSAPDARNAPRVWRQLGVLLALCLPVSTAAWSAQQSAPKTIWDGIYTEAQAQRGEQLFKSECSYCHRVDLSGGFFDNGTGRAATLAGPRAFGSSFEERWKDQTVGDMVATIAATMPQQRPTSLSVQTYVDIVSYLLAKNQIPAGKTELPVDVAALMQLNITPRPRD
jgi:mono/diheme cytochrome c family protein